MPRTPILIGSLALVATVLSPAAAPAETVFDHTLPSADNNGYVDTTLPPSQQFDRITSADQPNEVTEMNGRRVEIYGSIGDIEDKDVLDWRTINEYSRLVASVPADKEIYSTIYNSLWDGKTFGYDEVEDQWTIADPAQVFAPTAAFLLQANQRTPEQRANIHILGSRTTMNDAWRQQSSLARLVMRGHPGYAPEQVKAADYHECGRKDGGCLTVNSGGDLMHSKYAAFEQATDSNGTLRNNVVWITSSNLNGASGGHKSNTSIVIYDDAKAYNAVKNDIYGSQANGTNKIEDATAGYKAAITYNPVTQTIPGMSTDSGITLFPSPRSLTAVTTDADVAKVDVEAKYLRDRALAGPAGNCKVYTVHSLFSRNRSASLLSAMIQLQNKGCKVHIILGTNAISDIVDTYFAMSTDMRETIDRVEFANVHDKTLTYTDNSAANDVAFGGSANANGTSLEFDELAFRAQNTKVAKAVEAQSDRLYQLAKGRTTWTKPKSVTISPSTNPLKVRAGDRVQISTRVSPTNALVTETSWTSSNPSVATVSQTGMVEGKTAGQATITATAKSVNGVAVSSTPKTVSVTTSGTSSTGSAMHVTAPPTLTIERYQSPSGKTPFVVTWGSGKRAYQGVVKLQYYSKGWKTYKTWLQTDKNGVARGSFHISGSKTWRAYGARLDGIYENGQLVGDGGTAKTMSTDYGIVTVRTKAPTTTPRLYATSMVKKGNMVPMLVSWKYSSGKFRVQYKSGSKWKTYATGTIPKGGNQTLVSFPIKSTHAWRIATSSGATKVSNTVTISMK